MDDSMLVKTVADQYVRDMGSGAIPYLREMREIAASLPDAESAQAWLDIEDAARAMLPAAPSDLGRPAPQAGLGEPVPLI